MRAEWYFPAIMVFVELGAAAVYYLQDDWRKGTYWFLAALMTVVVTW